MVGVERRQTSLLSTDGVLRSSPAGIGRDLGGRISHMSKRSGRAQVYHMYSTSESLKAPPPPPPPPP